MMAIAGRTLPIVALTAAVAGLTLFSGGAVPLLETAGLLGLTAACERYRGVAPRVQSIAPSSAIQSPIAIGSDA